MRKDKSIFDELKLITRAEATRGMIRNWEGPQQQQQRIAAAAAAYLCHNQQRQ